MGGRGRGAVRVFGFKVLGSCVSVAECVHVCFQQGSKYTQGNELCQEEGRHFKSCN